MTGLKQARALGLLVPAALLAGALGSQYIGGLHPCEMCHWQRWPHYAALAFALASLALRSQMPDGGRSLVWLAALAIAVSGAIGAWHAGIELGMFEGVTQCAISGGSNATSAEIFADIMAAPLTRCDQVQWSFLGISMAGWNAIVSLGFAMVILWLSIRRPRIPA